ncbi:MAG: hypothetical protein R3F33_03335 [Planctomycetota bacterium]
MTPNAELAIFNTLDTHHLRMLRDALPKRKPLDTATAKHPVPIVEQVRTVKQYAVSHRHGGEAWVMERKPAGLCRPVDQRVQLLEPILSGILQRESGRDIELLNLPEQLPASRSVSISRNLPTAPHSSIQAGFKHT